MNQIIELEQSDDLIIGLSYSIQRLVVDHLHVVGDIYDRGPQPDKIMDTLINYHSVDIQWGNHDVLWIGAYAGSKACLANLLRICARYDNLDIIEDAYGINLRPLLTLAEEHYNGENLHSNLRNVLINQLDYLNLKKVKSLRFIKPLR